MEEDKLVQLLKDIGIEAIKNISQHQFNKLVDNFKYLDQSTVRSLIQSIPDLSDKISGYFKDIQAGFEMTKGREFLETMKEQQMILLQLQQQQDDPEIKRMVADELLEHSKWLRQETVTNRRFNMGMAMGGVVAASIFFLKISKNFSFSHQNAVINPRFPNGGGISPYDNYDQYGMGNFNYADIYNPSNSRMNNNYGVNNNPNYFESGSKIETGLFEDKVDSNNPNRFKNENIPMGNYQNDIKEYFHDFKSNNDKYDRNPFETELGTQQLQSKRQQRGMYDSFTSNDNSREKTVEPLI